MPLARTFVGFSSSDLDYYRLMLAWKEHEHIDFDFIDVQLPDPLRSRNERYIKDRCRERLMMAGTYVLLIGEDTRYKDQYVLWEAEVAIEKECRIIGVNLDKWRVLNPSTCPAVLQNVGVIFVPFSPHIVAEALQWQPPTPPTAPWYFFTDATYQGLGYIIGGQIAVRPPRANPFLQRMP